MFWEISAAKVENKTVHINTNFLQLQLNGGKEQVIAATVRAPFCETVAIALKTE